MEIASRLLKNYFISTSVLLFSLIVIVASTQAPYVLECEAGGPYARNATINVLGNFTNNSLGGVANISTNVSLGGTVQSSNNVTSDSDGRFHTSYFLNLDFDTYTVGVRAEANSTVVYCTDTVQVQLGLNTSCANRAITIEGIAFYSGNTTRVRNGTATVGLLEERVANSSSMNSTGGFRVTLNPCVKKGGKYTFSVIVDDNHGKRSSIQQIFVVP